MRKLKVRKKWGKSGKIKYRKGIGVVKIVWIEMRKVKRLIQV